jgi:MinD superfamily P-loop ATPase
MAFKLFQERALNAVQSLRGTDFALAVTEPTPLGIYDLKLILNLTCGLGIRTEVVVNKADLLGHEKEDVLAMARHRDQGDFRSAI